MCSSDLLKEEIQQLQIYLEQLLGREVAMALQNGSIGIGEVEAKFIVGTDKPSASADDEADLQRTEDTIEPPSPNEVRQFTWLVSLGSIGLLISGIVVFQQGLLGELAFTTGSGILMIIIILSQIFRMNIEDEYN